MNRPRLLTCLGLVVIVAAFAATWIVVPTRPGRDVPPLASLFLAGLGSKKCVKSAASDSRARRRYQRVALRRAAVVEPDPSYPLPPGVRRCVEYGSGVDLTVGDLDALKRRILVLYGSAAAVVLLLGIALGAARRGRA